MTMASVTATTNNSVRRKKRKRGRRSLSWLMGGFATELALETICREMKRNADLVKHVDSRLRKESLDPLHMLLKFSVWLGRRFNVNNPNPTFTQHPY